jgi:hypothetical protein
MAKMGQLKTENMAAVSIFSQPKVKDDLRRTDGKLGAVARFISSPHGFVKACVYATTTPY